MSPDQITPLQCHSMDSITDLSITQSIMCCLVPITSPIYQDWESPGKMAPSSKLSIRIIRTLYMFIPCRYGQPRWRSLVHSLMIARHCVMRNWDRIPIRTVKGLISRAGIVSICPFLWQRDVKLQHTKSVPLWPMLWHWRGVIWSGDIWAYYIGMESPIY